MDSLKKEIVGKVQQYLGTLERTTFPPRQPGNITISHYNLVTTINIWTPDGIREFQVKVSEVVS